MPSFQRRKFHDFYFEHYRTACLFLLRFQLKEQDAEDIVQHVFMEMWEKIQRGEQIDNLKAYLFVVCRNRAFRLLKEQELRISIEDFKNNDQDIGCTDLDEEIREAVSEEKLWVLIDNLPPERRKIFLMAKKEGRKYKEIASELNISVKTVENQIGRALKSLREKAIRLYLFLFS
ncbi:MAG: RNA polymerase sigma-70 factor [Bacteroidales bacterium]